MGIVVFTEPLNKNIYPESSRMSDFCGWFKAKMQNQKNDIIKEDINSDKALCSCQIFTDSRRDSIGGSIIYHKDKVYKTGHELCTYVTVRQTHLPGMWMKGNIG